MSNSPRPSTLGFMSCVREPSPDETKTNKKKFWNPKRWFKRKGSSKSDAHNKDNLEGCDTPSGTSRCRSLSHISVDSDPKNYSANTVLSVSHDSVFHSEPHLVEPRLQQTKSLESQTDARKSRTKIEQNLLQVVDYYLYLIYFIIMYILYFIC